MTSEPIGQGYIIVGGSRGIGLAVAESLAASGACVAIISRGDASDVAAKLAQKYDAVVESFIGDATKKHSIEAALQLASNALPTIEGLVTCNAERPVHTPDLLGTSDEDWLATFDDSVMGTVRCCRAVIPYLIDNGGGSIVTLGASSIRSPKPFLFPYSASKAAVANLTKNISRSFGDRGIRANCVCPGITETERSHTRVHNLMTEHNMSRYDAEQVVIKNLGMSVALQRLGRPAEIADTITFLLSKKSSYISGALINVDGGTEF